MLSSSARLPDEGFARASSSAPGASPTNIHRHRRRRRPARRRLRVWHKAARRACGDVGVEDRSESSARDAGDRARVARCGIDRAAGVERRHGCRRSRHRRVARSAPRVRVRARRDLRTHSGVEPELAQDSRRGSPSSGIVRRTSARRMTSASSRGRPSPSAGSSRSRRPTVRILSLRTARWRRDCDARTSRNTARRHAARASSRKRSRSARPSPSRRASGTTDRLSNLRLARRQHQHAVGDDAVARARRPAPGSRRPARRGNCRSSTARRGCCASSTAT